MIIERQPWGCRFFVSRIPRIPSVVSFGEKVGKNRAFWIVVGKIRQAFQEMGVPLQRNYKPGYHGSR